MYETYRMLGREHEAELEREARKRSLANEAAKRGLRWPLLMLALVVSAIALWATSASASSSPTDRATAPDLIERWVAAHPQASATARVDADTPDLVERWVASHR